MSSMVLTTPCTTSPPCTAVALADWARPEALRTVSTFCWMVAVICSMEAAVSSRLAACSSVRALRSALPEAIWLAPVAIDSLLWRTWLTMSARLARMEFSAASRLVVSPGRSATATARLPLATSCVICAA